MTNKQIGKGERTRQLDLPQKHFKRILRTIQPKSAKKLTGLGFFDAQKLRDIATEEENYQMKKNQEEEIKKKAELDKIKI